MPSAPTTPPEDPKELAKKPASQGGFGPESMASMIHRTFLFWNKTWLSRKDRQRREYFLLGEELNTLLVDGSLRMVVATANEFGGASKSWASVALADELADAIRAPVIVIEGRKGDANAIKMAGVDPSKTKSLREIHKLSSTLYDDPRDAFDTLGWNKYGVGVIKTDDDIPLDDNFGAKEAEGAVQYATRRVPFVIIDPGNEPTDPVNIGVSSGASVGLFVSTMEALCIDMLPKTVRKYKSHGLAHLVENCVYMMNKVEDRRIKAEACREAVGAPDDAPITATYHESAADYTKQVTVDKDGKIVVHIEPIDLDNYSLPLRLALRQTLVALARTAKAAQANKATNPQQSQGATGAAAPAANVQQLHSHDSNTTPRADTKSA